MTLDHASVEKVLRQTIDLVSEILNAPVSLYGGGPFQYELLLGDNDKKQVSLTDLKKLEMPSDMDVFGLINHCLRIVQLMLWKLRPRQRVPLSFG